MCGIVGVVSARPVEPGLVRAMADRIAHRGPDDSGIWLSDDRRIAFGHRRLSIVDLSPSGHQPMESADGRYVICYNGEIYNHREVRRAIEEAGGGPPADGRPWRGHSDTETLVEAIALWGLERSLARCAGMFALALWDRRMRRLQLARDRFGEKPLYYGWAGGAFLFGSELKALRRWPGFDNGLEPEALRLLLARTYIPAPLSIYRNVYKLEPGTILTVGAEQALEPRSAPPTAGASACGLSVERYWRYGDIVAAGLADPIRDEEEALERLEATLAAAIAEQSVADVPVGAFLSGGIDSSTIVGLYQKHVPGGVRTFSIGFEEAAFNEAEDAKAVARHFGTRHEEQYVSVREAQDVIPMLQDMYDEPFADSSQIPTYLLSRFARGQVTVALTGDGGDELFGGYNRYLSAPGLWRRSRAVPAPLRGVAARTLATIPPSAWRSLVDLLSSRRRSPHLGTKIQKIFRTLASSRDLDSFYASFLDEWSGSPSPVIGSGGDAADADLDLGPEAPIEVQMMHGDAVGYLPGDILCKVDRAAMAVSLETRVPFLDHRVAELAARIPLAMKIGGGEGKKIVRKLLYRQAPAAMFDRPKTGFGIPVGEWLRGPLRPWAEELLDAGRLGEDGLLDPAPIRARWEQHLSGKRDDTQAIWSVLMFQAWLQSGAGEPAEAAAGPPNTAVA